ncbi:MAG TPA: DUF397 domain-containing protein [Actinomycetes bacterium]|jgi:hypothetical protein
MADLSEENWIRSSYCANASCVEIAFIQNAVTVRDSKELRGPILQFSKTEWSQFLDGVRNGEFDSTIPSSRSR